MIYDVTICKVLDCFLIKILSPVMQLRLLFLPFLTIVTMVWSCTAHGQRNDEQEAEIQAQAEKAQQQYQVERNQCRQSSQQQIGIHSREVSRQRGAGPLSTPRRAPANRSQAGILCAHDRFTW